MTPKSLAPGAISLAELRRIARGSEPVALDVEAVNVPAAVGKKGGRAQPDPLRGAGDEERFHCSRFRKSLTTEAKSSRSNPSAKVRA